MVKRTPAEAGQIRLEWVKEATQLTVEIIEVIIRPSNIFYSPVWMYKDFPPHTFQHMIYIIIPCETSTPHLDAVHSDQAGN